MAHEAALADVKVLDFMWVIAGPAATRILADYGATVVHVESPSRVDTARTLHPRHHNEAALESSGCFGNNNAGKLGIALDLANPAARDVILDLVRWADVVTESFSPKAMRKWGFAYEDLRRVKTDVIMLSSCLMGQSGPLSKMAGFGTMGAAVSGFHALTGWPDRRPAGVFGAYTDYVSPRFTVIAILAALEHRRQTGSGQYIDLSQTEASTHFLTPAVLDYTVNGRVLDRMGNFDSVHAPHGVYPAAGADRWAAIVCRGDAEWRTLCDVMRRPDLVRFATVAMRIEHRDEIDHVIADWSSRLEAAEIERLLQARGIPAHEVQSSRECFADPQLRHRGHFVELDHPVYGKTIVEGSRSVLSRTPARVTRAAPTLGRDNQCVLAEILGYDEGRIADLVVSGVMG
jgi:crotonobetainyl-CoA:carnitine CoA-transferase CaiB-like acyl-CoA transferase